MGIADTLVVNYAEEAAVSGVSLVNQFNTIFVYLFTALASGGAVVISQYIGGKEPERTGRTVIGQCMGNKDTQAADYYFIKLSKITLLLSSVWNLLVFIFTPLFLRFYALEPQTKQLVIWLVLIHNVFNAAAFPFSGALSNGLRAAGDVKFTMYVSVLSTIAGRLFLSYLLGVVLHMGVIGITAAMVCDWIIRAILFIWRRKSGKWKEFRII